MLRDAGTFPAGKWSLCWNGPDNASMVAPDDVRGGRRRRGIPIYVISTNEVNKDPISSSVFRRITARTGGKAYWAKTWQKQVRLFESIREDLGNKATPSPTTSRGPTPNEGFLQNRVSKSRLTSGKKYRVRSATRYCPRA